MEWMNGLGHSHATTIQQQAVAGARCVGLLPQVRGRRARVALVEESALSCRPTICSRDGKELQKVTFLNNSTYLGMRKLCQGPCRSFSASLGFTADPRLGIERAANGLLKDAAMLLLYQDVLRSPPAQAFLKVLHTLRRADDGLRLLEAYGEFFKLMAIGRYSSWEDFVLEGILGGEKNPFAEAAANVGNSRSIWSGGVPPYLKAAAAADLDSLQRLSITESTLSGWVADMVADVRPEWRAAAASNVSCRTGVKPSVALENNSHAFGFGLSESKLADSRGRDMSDSGGRNTQTSGTTDGTDAEASGQFPVRTFVHEDREKWRKRIGGLWRWSEAVPLLEEYYAEHSIGRVASTQFLQWKGGKIMADPKWVTKISGVCNLSIQKANKDLLLKNLTRHARRCSSQHVLLFGPSGSGKTWMLRSVLKDVTSKRDLHILTLPVAELKSIYTVVEELARHWQLRFVLLIDDLFSAGGEDQYSFLKSALDGNVQEWPENVIVCATSNRKLIKDRVNGYLDSGHLFGLTLMFENLEEEEYAFCVNELAEHKKSQASMETVLSTDVMATQGKMWAEKLGARSVRTAAQFVNAHLSI